MRTDHGASCEHPLFHAPKLIITPRPTQIPWMVLGHEANFQGTPNLGIVTPGIYRGAQPNQAGFQELKAGGVKNIVDLRGGHTGV